VQRLLVRSAARVRQLRAIFNTGIAILVLDSHAKRRSAWVIMDEIRARLADLPGVRAFPVMRQGFGRAHQQAGSVRHRRRQLRGTGGLARHLGAEIERGQSGPDRPRLGLQGDQAAAAGEIDYDRAADLGVTGRHARPHPRDPARFAPRHHLLDRGLAKNTT
jgi:multidrug efflux pump